MRGDRKNIQYALSPIVTMNSMEINRKRQRRSRYLPLLTCVCVQIARRLEKARKKAEAIGNSDTSEKEKVQQMKQ